MKRKIPRIRHSSSRRFISNQAAAAAAVAEVAPLSVSQGILCVVDVCLPKSDFCGMLGIQRVIVSHPTEHR